MSNYDFNEVLAILNRRKAETNRQLLRYAQFMRTVSDRESDDLDVIVQQQEKESANRRMAECKLELDRIESALNRLTKGTYGICTRCHLPIVPERLKALPTAHRCLECQEKKSGPDVLCKTRYNSKGVGAFMSVPRPLRG